MTPAELVAAYDPEEPSNAVGRRLNTMANNEPFVVFESGRVVDTITTLKLLLEIKQSRLAGRERIEVNGDIRRVYKIGQLPDLMIEEDPLYPGRPLRPDGTCDQTGRSWAGISMEVRQLIRLAVETNELDVSIESAHNVMDLIMKGEDAAKRLRARYQKAAIKFDELNKCGNLPKLIMSVGQNKRTGLGDGTRVIFG